jgi:hypothetical protein
VSDKKVPREELYKEDEDEAGPAKA